MYRYIFFNPFRQRTLTEKSRSRVSDVVCAPLANNIKDNVPVCLLSTVAVGRRLFILQGSSTEVLAAKFVCVFVTCVRHKNTQKINK